MELTVAMLHGGADGDELGQIGAPFVAADIESHPELDKGETTDRTGSAVSFWPDPDVFETVDFDFQTIYRRLQEMAFLNRALRIHLLDERVAEAEDGRQREVTFFYEGGIADFVRHLNASKSPIHKTVVEFEAEEEGMSLEIAMQWNESYGESVYTFANTINTHEGGTHEEGSGPR